MIISIIPIRWLPLGIIPKNIIGINDAVKKIIPSQIYEYLLISLSSVVILAIRTFSNTLVSDNVSFSGTLPVGEVLTDALTDLSEFLLI